MKKINVIILSLISLLILSCGGNSNGNENNQGSEQSGSSGKHFAPKEKESSLSEDERDEALKSKRSELASISVDTILSPHSVRMTVLPPAIQGDITKSVCEKVTMKLLRIASQNGISGINGSSPIALALGLEAKDRAATGTAPQKMVVKYDATYYVLNTQTGDVYGSTSTTVTGVGASFENATSNAVEQLQNSRDIASMISESDKSIITWFNQNSQVIINKVNSAVADKNYTLAVALLHSVPEQATVCHGAISKLQTTVEQKMKQQIAADELAALKGAIAEAGSDYSAECAAHLAMLPVGTNEYKEGHSAFDNYIKHINNAKMAQIAAEERARLEEIELRKLQMKYDAEAAANAKSSSDDGFLSNAVGKAKTFMAGAGAASMVGNVLSRCLFLF